MFQALKAKATGKQASSIQFDIKIHDASQLPVAPGTAIYAQWKRKNKVRTSDVYVDSEGHALFEETLIDVGSMMKSAGASTFDDKVGELSVCTSTGVLGSVELNLAEFASANPGGTSRKVTVQVRSKKSTVGELNVTVSSLLASLVEAVNNATKPQRAASLKPTAGEVEELHSQIEELQEELNEETAHSEAMSAEVQRLLSVIADLESQLLDSDGAMLAAEERKASAMRLMAKMVQNSISDLAKWGFTTWRLGVMDVRDERNTEWSATRSEQLVRELNAVRTEASWSKANLALKRLMYAAMAKGFSSWKDLVSVSKRMHELDKLYGYQRLAALKEPIQKIEFVLTMWARGKVAVCVSSWRRNTQADTIREMLLGEQWFARNQICDQRYAVIVRQWRSSHQARAVANWWQNVLVNRAHQAASTGLAGKNKHNYEVLCRRILKLDSTIFNSYVSSAILWYRSELRRNFAVWKSIYMSRSSNVWEMRSGLQKLRTKAAGSFVKLLEGFEWRVRTGALQRAWGLWRTFLVENMMAMHQAMVEKLWGRNQAQAAEMEVMHREIQFGRALGSTMEENQELKKTNLMLAERNSQILTHSDEVVENVQESLEALRYEVAEWKGKASMYELECAGLKEATLEEQSDFLDLFAKQAERCVMEREACLKTIIGLFGKFALSANFLHWAKVVGQKQLRESLHLVDTANSQLREVIAKVSNEQSQLPRLQQELEASNRDRDELRATVERNMQYTQALITNLNFLKSALPSHVASQLPSHPISPGLPTNSQSPGSSSRPQVSLEDLMQPEFSHSLRRSRR